MRFTLLRKNTCKSQLYIVEIFESYLAKNCYWNSANVSISSRRLTLTCCLSCITLLLTIRTIIPQLEQPRGRKANWLPSFCARGCVPLPTNPLAHISAVFAQWLYNYTINNRKYHIHISDEPPRRAAAQSAY